jgi:hypothetical protein
MEMVRSRENAIFLESCTGISDLTYMYAVISDTQNTCVNTVISDLTWLVSVVYHLCESWTSFFVVMVAFVCNDETFSANMELLMLPIDACQTVAISIQKSPLYSRHDTIK